MTPASNLSLSSPSLTILSFHLPTTGFVGARKRLSRSNYDQEWLSCFPFPFSITPSTPAFSHCSWLRQFLTNRQQKATSDSWVQAGSHQGWEGKGGASCLPAKAPPLISVEDGGDGGGKVELEEAGRGAAGLGLVKRAVRKVVSVLSNLPLVIGEMSTIALSWLWVCFLLSLFFFWSIVR